MTSSSHSIDRLSEAFSHRITRRRIVQGAMVAPLVGAAAVTAGRHVSAQDDAIRIGSKDFAEQFILAEIYGALLDNAGISVDLSKLNLAGTAIAHEALVNDEIDMYPEYPGTAFEAILGLSLADAKAAIGGGGATPVAGGATPVAGDATPVAGMTLDQYIYDAVSQAYLEQFNVVLLAESAFNDTQALAVTRAFSEENGITTISQLAAVAADFTIVGPSDFETRSDGLVGLQETYGAGFNDITTVGVQPGLRYQALEDGDADIVLAFSTEGQIPAMDLVVLQDDLGLWPPYHCAPFVRKDVLDANPQIADILNPVFSLLTDDVMASLNGKVDLDGEEPADVARGWLEEQGLLTA